jgi:hypothetical protein
MALIPAEERPVRLAEQIVDVEVEPIAVTALKPPQEAGREQGVASPPQATASASTATSRTRGGPSTGSRNQKVLPRS